MSTKTTNYELLKPELTDPADITAINPNWDAIDEELHDLHSVIKTSSIQMVNATSSDGVAYTATIAEVTSLYSGLAIFFIPNKTTTSTKPTLNLNGLGAKNIRRKLSFGAGSTSVGSMNTWFYMNRPSLLVYDGTQWIAEDFTQPCASDLYGTVDIEKGGTGATDPKGAEYAISGGMSESTNAIDDDNQLVFKQSSPSETSGVFIYKTASRLWTYILGKIRSTFGFTSSNVLPIANGGTGATTAAGIRKTLGLGDTTGAVPVNCGGTNATTADGACESIGAVKKSGDTMAGTLYTQGTPAVVIGTASNPKMFEIAHYTAAENGSRLAVRQYGNNGKRDTFNLPYTKDTAENTNYYILTSKNPVTIEQGGTGGTTSRAAEYAICNDIKSATSSISDDEMIVVKRSSSSASATNGAFATKTASLLWAYFKKKQHVQCGVVNDVNSTGVTITFPEAFAGIPVVVASGGSESSASVRVRDITKTGCRLVSAASNNDGVQWIAVYQS